MDIITPIVTFFSWLWTLVLTVWAIILAPTYLPLGIGYVVTVFYWFVIGWILWRFRSIRQFIKPHLMRLVRKTIRGLGRLAGEEQTSNEAVTRHDAPSNDRRRTLKSALFLRARWVAYTTIVIYSAQNWSTVGPYVRQVIPI